MISDEMLNSIVRAIHAQSELHGCRIGFEGNGQSRVLHQGLSPSVNYTRIFVVVEALEITGTAPILSPIPSEVGSPPAIITNGSRLRQELIGAGLSCSLTVVSGVAVVGGVAGEIPSAGASTLLVIAGGTGLVTSGAQCANGLVRSYQAMVNADDNSLQRWDDNRYYSTAFLVIDAVGVVSSLVSLPFAVRNLYAILERRGGLMAANQLSNLSRAERAAQTEEALRRATQTAEGRQAVEAALREAGLTERQVAQVFTHGAATTRRATIVSRVLTVETTTRLNATLRDIISGVAGIGVSATPSSWTGSGSGSVNSLIVNVLAN